MAYARPFGQAQNASPWSAGVPPGIQQPQQAGQTAPPMFGQPMGPFDLSGGWQNQQQAGPQWVPAMQQPVQFVPNPAAFMQQNQNQQHQMHRQQMPHMRNNQQNNQQQRPMHQRSLSAPRVSVNGQNKRQFNNNNNFNSGGQQRQYNNNQQQQQRTPRQQSRMNNNNNFNNNSTNSNDKGNQKNSAQVNNNNKSQQHQQQQQQKQQQQQQQQQQQNQQQNQKKGTAKVVVKVTKVKKLNALKAKQGAKPVDNNAASADDKADCPETIGQNQTTSEEKLQSKTAERKQFKQLARKNAESLNKSILPVCKTNFGANAQKNSADSNADEPIDQAQLKCVPAVFGFVCKICDIFLKDKIARREHIDSADHMERFAVMEKEEKQKSAEMEQKAAASEEEHKADAPVVESEEQKDSTDEQKESTDQADSGEAKVTDEEMKE